MEFEREIQALTTSFSQAAKMAQLKKAPGGILIPESFQGLSGRKDFDDINERLLGASN